MDNSTLIKEITKNLIDNLSLNKLNLDMAKILIDKCERKSKEINVPVTIAIVDNSGNFIAQHRMDDSLLVSIPISINKAYTAVAMKMSTLDLSKLVVPGESLYGLSSMDRTRICTIGGGIPIFYNGKLIGGIGVSGGTVEEDIIIAEYALKEL